MVQYDVPSVSRAAVLTEFNEPLEVQDVRVPSEIEPEAILVKTEMSSICGSDVHLWDGSLAASLPVDLPVIPGHEMVGSIVRLGQGAEYDSVGHSLAEGDRIVFTHAACGRCHYCITVNQPGLCKGRQYYMFTNCHRYPYLTGGFSEYCYVFPRSGRVRVPDDVKTEWASAASCALRTVMHSFQRLGSIEPWQTVVIQGAGPLGLFATAVADHCGAARVITIGAPASRLDLARKWGASDVISVEDAKDAKDRVDAVRALTASEGGADIVMELSGAGSAFREGLGFIRDGGRYVVTGQVGGDEVPISPASITRRHLTILGCWSGEAAQYWRALEFISRTQDKYNFDQLISGQYNLDQINLAMSRMQAHQEIKPVILPSMSGGS